MRLLTANGGHGSGLTASWVHLRLISHQPGANCPQEPRRGDLTDRNRQHVNNYSPGDVNGTAPVRKQLYSAELPFKNSHLLAFSLTASSPVRRLGTTEEDHVVSWRALTAFPRRRLVIQRVTLTFPVNCQELIGQQKLSLDPPIWSCTSWTAMIGWAARGSVPWLAVGMLMKRLKNSGWDWNWFLQILIHKLI